MSAASRIAAGVLAVAAGTGVVRGDVLYDTLWITDTVAYDSGIGNARAGSGVFGALTDLRAADDFVIDGGQYPDGARLTHVAQDSLCFLGDLPRDGFDVRLMQGELGSMWCNVLAKAVVPLADVVATPFSDPIFDFYGYRFEMDLSRHGIRLPPGEHWVAITPIDESHEGDWYYQVADEDQVVGQPARDKYFFDYACGNSEWPITLAMRIEGVPYCLADFDGDGSASSEDVIAFLGAWAARDPRADIDGDGAIDTRDVIAFLNAWVDGC